MATPDSLSSEPLPLFSVGAAPFENSNLGDSGVARASGVEVVRRFSAYQLSAYSLPADLKAPWDGTCVLCPSERLRDRLSQSG